MGLEQRILARWSGFQILVGSLLVGAIGTLPLMLYIAFGPADGNPIGLGLLAVAVLPVAAAGALIGLFKWVTEWIAGGRN